MIFTLTLNPALDYYMYLDKYDTNNLNVCNKVDYIAGGKGINVSIMLKNLGVLSTCLGYTAGFTGNFIKESLDKIGISHNFIDIEGNTRINVKINEDGKETELAGLSPKITELKEKKLIDLVSKLTSDDYLVLSGSIPNTMNQEIYKKLSLNTRAKVFLDTRGSTLMENIYNNILIKPNIHELEEVFNKEIKDFDTMYDLCVKFFEKGVEYVMVSLGGKGCALLTKDKILFADVPEGKLINSIGAGDSTVAGFVYGYAQEMSNEEILKLCVACGSSTAYSYGIGSKENVDKLKRTIKCIEIKYGKKQEI